MEASVHWQESRICAYLSKLAGIQLFTLGELEVILPFLMFAVVMNAIYFVAIPALQGRNYPLREAIESLSERF